MKESKSAECGGEESEMTLVISFFIVLQHPKDP